MPVKAKIRLDYKAETRGWFFRRHKDPRELAKQNRARQVSLLRNLPFQGLSVADLDLQQEVYTISEGDQEVAYAPVEVVVEADSIEDLMPLTLREEFRKIKLLEPEEISISTVDLERFLFKVNEEYRAELE